jgi:ribonuclease G
VRSELLIAVSPGELWAALVEEGRLAALRVLRPGAGGQVGQIYLGRVVAVRPELPAALVDIGLDRPAFLSAEDALPRGSLAALEEGRAIVVQVAKEARADKAAGLSMRPRLAGRLVDLTPQRAGITAEKGLTPAERDRLAAALAPFIEADGGGFILHGAAAGAQAKEIAAEAEALRGRWRSILARSAARRAPALLEEPGAAIAALLSELAGSLDAIVIDDLAASVEARQWLARHRPALVERVSLHRERTPLFEHHGVAEDVAAALAPRLTLADGVALTIEHGAAATLIDVDSGSAGGRGGDAAAAGLAANLRAAREAARQIRLRNLAGPIVIDFIGMRDKGGRERVRALVAELLAEEGDAEVLGWTRLGHLELVRKRRHAPLAELLFERAPGGGLTKTALTIALEALRALAREAEASPGRPLSLRVAPEVAAALDTTARAAKQSLEARLGRPLSIAAEPRRAREAFEIVRG